MGRTEDHILLENLLRDPYDHWKAFAERFAPLVEGCVHSSMVPSSNREDFIQDIYYELLRNDMSRLRRWDPKRATLRVFLKVVVSRIIVDLFRARRYRTEQRPGGRKHDDEEDRDWERIESKGPSPRDAAAIRESWKVLHREVLELMERGKARPVDLLIVQGKLMGMDSRDIAKMTNLSENTVNVRFHRLRKHLTGRMAIQDFPG
jgi:RNA polymerase sigma factor (sigma-70 family)